MAEQTGKLIDERNEGKNPWEHFFRENEQKVQNICCHDVWLYPPELEQLETDILTFLFSDVLTK